MRFVSKPALERFQSHPENSLSSLNANMRDEPFGKQFCLDFFRTPDKYTANGISLAVFIARLDQANLLKLISAVTQNEITAEAFIAKIPVEKSELIEKFKSWNLETIETREKYVVDLFNAAGVVHSFCRSSQHYDKARCFVAKEWIMQSCRVALAAAPGVDPTVGIDQIQQFHSQFTLGLGTVVGDLFFVELKNLLVDEFNCALTSGNNRTIDISYVDKAWHYIVSDKLVLNGGSLKNSIPVSKTRCDFKIFEEGFELTSLEYDNEYIRSALDSGTLESQLPILGQLIRENALNDALTILLKMLIRFADAIHVSLAPSVRALYAAASTHLNAQSLYQTFMYELDKDTIAAFRSEPVKKYLNKLYPKKIEDAFCMLVDEALKGIKSSDVTKALNKTCFMSYQSRHDNPEEVQDLANVLAVENNQTCFLLKNDAGIKAMMLYTSPDILLNAIKVELKKQSLSSSVDFFKKSTHSDFNLEKFLSSKVPDEKIILSTAFYEVRKSQIKAILPYVTADDGIKLIFELLKLQGSLKIKDATFPLPTTATDLVQFRLLYDVVANQLMGSGASKGKARVIALDEVGMSEEHKMFFLCKELLNDSNSPVKTAISDVADKMASTSSEESVDKGL